MTAIGRNLMEVAASVKDVIQEMQEFEEADCGVWWLKHLFALIIFQVVSHQYIEVAIDYCRK